MGGFFKQKAFYTPVQGWMKDILSDFLSGKSTRTDPETLSLKALFDAVSGTMAKGRPFFESLIPGAPGELSPAADAERAAAMDALQTQLGSERVGMTGSLGRRYGGRLPASMLASGFGNLARAGTEGATDIGRRAVSRNIELGQEGISGLSSLAQLGGLPTQVLGGAAEIARPMGLVKSGFSSLVEDISKLAGAAAGVATGFPGGAGAGSKLGKLPTTRPVQQTPYLSGFSPGG